MADQSEDKRSIIIIGALVLTAAFLGLFALLLNRTTTCAEGWWLWHRLDCLEPNALGDTFAGAFAPVAFVWLVAAVLLQRNELAAQRQELRESRAVATQQVEEAKKNVEFISEQTHILREQLDSAHIRRSDEDIQKMMEIAVDQYRSISEHFALTDGKGSVDENNAPRPPLYFPEIVSPGYDKKHFRVATVMSRMALLYAQAHLYQHGDISYRGWAGVEDLAEVLDEIDAASANASRPVQVELARTNVSRAREQIDELKALLKEHGTLDNGATIFDQKIE